MAASTTSARIGSAQTRKFTSASSMNNCAIVVNLLIAVNIYDMFGIDTSASLL